MTEKELKILRILNEITTWERDPINELIGSFNENSELLKRLIIIGPTQIGKTTLIMDLIGIKTEEKSFIEKVFRGGTEHGKSSTSTAVIYSCSSIEETSPDYDKFGWADGKLTDSMSSLDFLYFSPDELCDKIKAINEENRNGSTFIESEAEMVTYILIPPKYFNDDAPKDLHLVDLPGFGDGSGEKMRKKIRNTIEGLSDFTAGIIAVVKAENITYLSQVYKEYIYDKYADSVLVAVSHSVANSDEVKKKLGNINDPFEAEGIIRKHYSEKIAGLEEPCHYDIERFKERIFPIESKIWLENNAYSAISDLPDCQRQAILDAIKKMECKTGIDICLQNISKRISQMKNTIKTKNGENDILEKERNDLKKKDENYKKLLEEAEKAYKDKSEEIDSEGIELCKRVSSKGRSISAADLFYEVGGKKEKNVVNVQDRLSNYLVDYVENIIREAFEDDFYDIEYESYLKKVEEIIDEKISENDSIITPRKDGLFTKKFGYSWSEAAAPECEKILKAALSSFRKRFRSEIAKRNSKVEKEMKELEKRKYTYRQLCKSADDRIKDKESKIKENNIIIIELNHEIRNLEEKKNHIYEVFIRHFNKKYDELTSRINAETDLDIQSALIITQSTIVNNMKGAIKNHEQLYSE